MRRFTTGFKRTPRSRVAPLGRLARLLPLAVMALLSGCSLEHGFLHPHGRVAHDERTLFFEVIALTLIVVVPVLVGTPWLLWRYRRGKNNNAAYKPKWTFSWTLEILAWGVPILIVAVLGVMVWINSHKLDPYRPLPSNQKPLTVQVIGLDWKWLFIYPDQHVASVNQLVIPTGRPVHLEMTSDTVMLSLLIPRLAGQIYAMAGMKTQQWLQADQPGNFRGENTQYNGFGFQKQKFRTIATAPASFESWIDKVRASGQSLDCPTYKQLARPSNVDKPRFYRSVTPGLFSWVIHKYVLHPAPACGAAANGSHA